MINNEIIYDKAIQSLGNYAYSYTSPLSSFEDIDWVFDSPSKEDVELKYAELQAAEPMRQLRQQRDQKLAQSDWMAVSDRTMTPEQIAYRQALRDMPANNPDVALDDAGELINITWPTEPTT